MLWYVAVVTVAVVTGHGDDIPHGGWADRSPQPNRENQQFGGERAKDGGQANEHNIQIIDVRMPQVFPEKV